MFKDTEKELARLQEALLEEEEPHLPVVEDEDIGDVDTYRNFSNGYGGETDEPERRGRSTTVKLMVLAISLLLGIVALVLYWAIQLLGLLR